MSVSPDKIAAARDDLDAHVRAIVEWHFSPETGCPFWLSYAQQLYCGGTEMNAQFHRFAREELVPGLAFVPTYGNTLMGLACPKPFDPADEYAITYYPPQPRAVIELVDPKGSATERPAKSCSPP